MRKLEVLCFSLKNSDLESRRSIMAVFSLTELSTYSSGCNVGRYNHDRGMHNQSPVFSIDYFRVVSNL